MAKATQKAEQVSHTFEHAQQVLNVLTGLLFIAAGILLGFNSRAFFGLRYCARFNSLCHYVNKLSVQRERCSAASVVYFGILIVIVDNVQTVYACAKISVCDGIGNGESFCVFLSGFCGSCRLGQLGCRQTVEALCGCVLIYCSADNTFIKLPAGILKLRADHCRVGYYRRLRLGAFL